MDQAQEKQLQGLKECITTLQNESKEFENERQSLFRDLSDEIKFLIGRFDKIDWRIGGNIKEGNSLKKVPFKVERQEINQQNKKCKEIIRNQGQLILRYERQLKQKDQQTLKMQQKLKENMQELRQKQAELDEKNQLLNQVLQELNIKEEVMGKNEKILEERERKLDVIMHNLQREVEQTKSQLERSLHSHERSKKFQERPLHLYERTFNYQHQQYKSPSQERQQSPALLAQSFTQKLLHFESTFQESHTQLNDKVQILMETVQKLNLAERDLSDKNQRIQSLEQDLITERQKYQLQLQALMQQHLIEMEAQNWQKDLQIQQLIKQNITRSQKQINELTLNQETKLKQTQNKCIERQKSLKSLMFQHQNFKEAKNSQNIPIIQSKITDKMKLITQKDSLIKNNKQQLIIVSKKLHQKEEQFKKIQIAKKFLQTKNADMIGQIQKCKRLHEETNSIANKRLKFIQNQLKETRKTNIQFKKSISSLSQMVQSLKREVINKSISIQSLERQLQRAKSYNEILLSDVKSLNSKLKTLNQQIQENQESSHDLKKKNLTQKEESTKNKFANRIFSKTSFQPVLSQTKSLGYFSRNEREKSSSIALRKQYENSLIERRSFKIGKRDLQRTFSALNAQIQIKQNDNKPTQSEQSQIQRGLVHLYSMQTTFSPYIPSNNQLGENSARNFFRKQSLKLNFNQQNLPEQIQNISLSNHSNILPQQNQDKNLKQFMSSSQPITFRKSSQQLYKNLKQLRNSVKISCVETEQQLNQQNGDFYRQEAIQSNNMGGSSKLHDAGQRKNEKNMYISSKVFDNIKTEIH